MDTIVQNHIDGTMAKSWSIQWQHSTCVHLQLHIHLPMEKTAAVPWALIPIICHHGVTLHNIIKHCLLLVWSGYDSGVLHNSGKPATTALQR